MFYWKKEKSFGDILRGYVLKARVRAYIYFFFFFFISERALLNVKRDTHNRVFHDKVSPYRSCTLNSKDHSRGIYILCRASMKLRF